MDTPKRSLLCGGATSVDDVEEMERAPSIPPKRRAKANRARCRKGCLASSRASELAFGETPGVD